MHAANVTKRLVADMKNRARAETATRWRLRAAVFVAAAVAITAIGFFLFTPSKTDVSDIHFGVTDVPPSPVDVSDVRRAKTDTASLRERVAAAETRDALSILVSTRETLESETPAYMSAALPKLVNPHEQLLLRAHGTPQEAGSRLELSRLYQQVWSAAMSEVERRKPLNQKQLKFCSFSL